MTQEPKVPATVAVTYPCTDKGDGSEGSGADPRECPADGPQRRADAPQPGRPQRTGTDSLSGQTGAGAAPCNTDTVQEAGKCYVVVPFEQGLRLVDLAVDGHFPATSEGFKLRSGLEREHFHCSVQ